MLTLRATEHGASLWSYLPTYFDFHFVPSETWMIINGCYVTVCCSWTATTETNARSSAYWCWCVFVNRWLAGVYCSESGENLNSLLHTATVQGGWIQLSALHTFAYPPVTVDASNLWRLAVPTAAHSTVYIHSICFWPTLMPCCAYSCTQWGPHTQYMLLTNADALLCLQLHTVRSPHTVHASDQRWCLAVSTAAHSTVSIHSTYF